MTYSLSHRFGLARSLAIYYGQPWKLRRMRRLYGRWVGNGSLCFDIGAHVGNRTHVWRKLGATVVSLEPQPLFADWLRWQFRADSSATIVEEAVGSSVGTASLQVSPRTPTVSSVSAEWVNQVQQSSGFQHVRWQEQLTVPQTTLDALIETYGRPAFCKIDVEGHELDVLNGLTQALDALSFEVIAAAKSQAFACVERLEVLGNYRFAYSIGEQNQLSDWIDGNGLKVWLNSLRETGPSADVFAELAVR